MLPRSRALAAAAVAVVLAAALSPRPAAAENFEVITSGFTFSPDTITIAPGDTIDFTIGLGHNVVQTVAEGSCDMLPGGFLSGSDELDTSVRSFSVTLTDPGIYYYKCNPHCPFGMRGIIIVDPPTGAPETSEALPWGRVKARYRR